MSLQLGREGLALARGSVENVAARIRSRLAFAWNDAALPADIRLALQGAPLVESLEGRRLLAVTSTAAATLTFASGTVTFVGNATQSNAFVATLSGDAKTITVKANAKTATYNTADVKGFRLVGGAAADWLELGATVPLPSTMNGGAGNDTLLGGAHVDWLRGEAGDDWTEGRSGWNYLYAGNGNDTIIGGELNDWIRGEDGNDVLDGGAGTDSAEGGSGTDVAYNAETTKDVETKKTGSLTPISTTAGSTGSAGGSTGSTGGSTGGTTGGSTGGATGATVPVVANASAPVARIVAVTSTTILAGQAVHVDALTSTLNYGDPTTARYEWNFGDAAGTYNALVGYNAAHVYATAGTYTVTLRVINEAGKAATTTTKVTVSADNRATVYVSAAGNDANDGTSTAKAIKTFARATQIVYASGGDLKVLFRRGDTFDVNNDMVVRSDDVLVGAYGTGNSPVLKYVGSRTKNVWTISAANAKVTGMTVRDLTFDSIYSNDTLQTYMPTSITLPGKNSLVQNNVFKNVGYATNITPTSVGTLVQGNSAPLATGIRGYFMWTEGTNVVALGNTVVNSTREHIIRTNKATRVLIYDNDLTNADRRNVDPDDYSKSTIHIQQGSYAYISGNTLTGATTIGPLGVASNVAEKATRTLYAVFEGNHQVSGIMTVSHGAEHVMIRNNLYDYDNEVQINVEGYSTLFGRGVVDLSIINNTGLNEGTRGVFLRTASPVEGIQLMNNLYVAPNLWTGDYAAAPVQVWDTDMSNFTTVTANIWGDPNKYKGADGGINWVGTENSSKSYQDATEWNALAGVGTDLFTDVTVTSKYAPVGADAVVNAGVATGGVFVDYYGTYRDVADWTIGAVQL